MIDPLKQKEIDNGKAIAEGEICERLIANPDFDWFRNKLALKVINLEKTILGKNCNDIAKVNYDNGRWAGLAEAARIIQNAITLKDKTIDHA